MSDRAIIHDTFTLQRTYDTPPGRVFAAWADPAAKGRWFAGPGAAHNLDFRVGGREVTRGNHDGTAMTFESEYREIVPDERIVYTSTMSADQTLWTVSLTTVEFAAADGGTRLTLTEHGAFLDGHEQPVWREQGTGAWLDALGPELADRVEA
jgi:uncharacterized protein YndB with AHSA1/START domain